MQRPSIRNIPTVVIVASSVILSACSQTHSGERPSGISTPPAASTAATTTAPSSPPPGVYQSTPAPGDQASAETAIKEGYVKKLADCYATRNAVATVVAINWNPPGFTTNQGGTGHIESSEPALGGLFTAKYDDGRWNVEYHWC